MNETQSFATLFANCAHMLPNKLGVGGFDSPGDYPGLSETNQVHFLYQLAQYALLRIKGESCPGFHLASQPGHDRHH